VELPDDQVYQTNQSIKQSKNKKENKSQFIKLEQELDISECFFSKNLKQPTRIASCSILDRYVQWSRHLERKQTKTTNASSKNF
jgi:hypothetical protein